MKTRTNGFTLLELVVAVSVLALVSAIAYGGLNGLIRQHEAARAEVARTAVLQRTMALLANDLLQVHPRSVREEFRGDRVAAMIGGPAGEFVAEFTRGGWSNPAQHRRATLQRVAWRLNRDRIERIHWQVLDRGPLAVPVITPLADGVLRFQWRFLDAQGEWQEFWPSIREREPDLDRLPMAVEIAFTFEGDSGMTRVFQLNGR